MAFSPMLALYLTASRWMVPIANRKLASRLAEGKEDPDRINERRGIASQPRPPGELIWFHAASVGESLSLLDLIDSLIDENPDLNVLITTGTRSSADLLQSRLPDQTIHQFVPLDARPFVQAFLEYWKPDVAIWTESELWPALIHETRDRGIGMISLNTRMSQSSYRKWHRIRGAARALLSKFDLFLAQDRLTAKHLLRLGAPADRDLISISFGDVNVATKGWVNPNYVEAEAAVLMKKQEIDITVDLGMGTGTATVWTCDLTHGYIEINADYRS